MYVLCKSKFLEECVEVSQAPWVMLFLNWHLTKFRNCQGLFWNCGLPYPADFSTTAIGLAIPGAANIGQERWQNGGFADVLDHLRYVDGVPSDSSLALTVSCKHRYVELLVNIFWQGFPVESIKKLTQYVRNYNMFRRLSEYSPSASAAQDRRGLLEIQTWVAWLRPVRLCRRAPGIHA